MADESEFALEDDFAGAAAHKVPESVPADFDEAAYLQAFPDIAASIRLSEYESALDHYLKQGAHEGRLMDARYQRARGRQPAPTVGHGFSPCGVDLMLISPAGACLVIGWIDDRAARLGKITLKSFGRIVASTTQVARCRREDAETSLSAPPGHLFGFWTLLHDPKKQTFAGACSVELHGSEATHSAGIEPRTVTDAQLRDALFEYFAAATYFGTPQLESFVQLESGPGSELLRFNREFSGAITRLAHVERFGPARKKFRGSIVVCLFGKPEFMFLQNALFAAGPPGGQQSTAYEYIYVSNSPELIEILQKEAKIAERIYGLSVTLVFLPDNAGFGAANNAGVKAARSDRILIVNPDVFPREPNWAEIHSRLIKDLPKEQTAMFGVPLFYDDGSLMHGGMYFDIDTGLLVRPEGISRHLLIRVEHYGKGAPPGTAAYLRSRRVPAVTGAFISADRALFERLGGFSEDYVFGHYEDADLCLKSLAAGRAVWMHDIGFWHLEGKGSTRRAAHEGGVLVNRWHFTKSWGTLIEASLFGREPESLRVGMEAP